MPEQTYSTRVFALLPVAAIGLLLAGYAVAAEDESSIVKDSIQVTAFTFNVYHKSFDTWSWAPKLDFRVNGPIASGSQLYAEFNIPGSAPVKFDCKTGQIQKGHRWKTECGARDVPEDKGTTYTGNVDFSIHMRNELANTDATLFTGKMKVAKVHSNEHGPKVANHFVYYVDQDWNLPIGYVYLTPDSVTKWQRPTFGAAFWFRGDVLGFEPHLFYQGKEVGQMFLGNMEMGKASCSTTEVEDNTSQFVDDSLPQKARWARMSCSFPNVVGWDKTGENISIPGQKGSRHLFSANPGDYELKVLWKGHLARSIKFTVGPEGKFDNGIASSNKLGTDRVVVPVQIIGDQDGNWNRTAWKTDAFYSNPLAGFTAAP
ncbi:MAG TPA: hypothetical protein VKU01_19160 [Bryobacteraceae bacterium]|nr:hypothetical protein [Bryobacteraceae bacterium]